MTCKDCLHYEACKDTTDKKFTDREIIKALEYCLADKIECDKCALQIECESNPFYSTIAKYALDLIKRQKQRLRG